LPMRLGLERARRIQMSQSTDDPARDPAQIDVAWVGHDSRAMVPTIALIAAVSLLVWTGRWYFVDLSDFADAVGDWAIFALAWAVWPALAVAFLYRTVLHTYRLTDRAVLVEFGFLSPPVPPILLRDVTAVVIGGSWLRRLLNVGWVEMRTADRIVRLKGVRNPALFAERIRATRAALQPQIRVAEQNR
jgi:hypothetical protein